MPEYMMESRPSSVESLTEVTDAANSLAPTSSANSSVSNMSIEPITLANSLNNARALLKKKSLVQVINNYIRAGIEEGAFSGRTPFRRVSSHRKVEIFFRINSQTKSSIYTRKL